MKKRQLILILFCGCLFLFAGKVAYGAGYLQQCTVGKFSTTSQGDCGSGMTCSPCANGQSDVCSGYCDFPNPHANDCRVPNVGCSPANRRISDLCSNVAKGSSSICQNNGYLCNASDGYCYLQCQPTCDATSCVAYCSVCGNGGINCPNAGCSGGNAPKCSSCTTLNVQGQCATGLTCLQESDGQYCDSGQGGNCTKCAQNGFTCIPAGNCLNTKSFKCGTGQECCGDSAGTTAGTTGGACNHNGICEPNLGENSATCPDDCPPTTTASSTATSTTTGPYCGDGKGCAEIGAGKNCLNCALECGACPSSTGGGTTTGPYCGDGQCLGAETCSTCPSDCGACTTSSTTGPPPTTVGTTTSGNCPGYCDLDNGTACASSIFHPNGGTLNRSYTCSSIGYACCIPNSTGTTGTTTIIKQPLTLSCDASIPNQISWSFSGGDDSTKTLQIIKGRAIDATFNSPPSLSGIIWPVNQKTPTSYTATLSDSTSLAVTQTCTTASICSQCTSSAECQINSCSGTYCNPSGICSAPPKPWFSSKGGEIRIDTSFSDKLPDTSVYALLNGKGGSHGVLFTSLSPDLGANQTSAVQGQNLVTQGQKFHADSAGLSNSYMYYQNLLKDNGVTPITNTCSSLDCVALSPNGVYQLSSNVVVPPGATPLRFTGNKDYVILINGNLDIKNNILVDVGSTLTVAVSGNITVEPNVGENPPYHIQSEDICNPNTHNACNLEGFYIADGSFTLKGGNSTCNKAADKQLNIGGAIAVNGNLSSNSNAFNFYTTNQRNLCNNNANTPALTVTERPDMILNAPQFLMTKNFIWHEVSP